MFHVFRCISYQNNCLLGNTKKETVGLKLDEDQLKILDDLPNSAVEMQVKDKVRVKIIISYWNSIIYHRLVNKKKS